MDSNVLILGDGLLATELAKQTGWNYISRKKDGIDFLDVDSYYPLLLHYEPKVIINCIAHTDTYSTDRKKHWDINYKGVNDLVHVCNNMQVKLVHISTDYLYANSLNNASEDDVPAALPNWYSYTKLLADGLVQLLSRDYLLIRTTFKPRPYKYDVAWNDLVGNFDYIDIITNDIITLIKNEASGIYNVGTEIKTMLDLAQRTRPDVHDTPIGPLTRPHNTTMNTDKLNKFKETSHD